MKSERLEWLDLSPPPIPTRKKIADAGTPPCPTCGWPAQLGTTNCNHCGHPLDGNGQAVDALAELAVELPEPVIDIEPPPERWFDGQIADSPALYALRLRAERMRVTTGFDRLICLDDISVEHYQHQLEAALRALRDMRGQALLADEVGLGKTIEAGIVMKELIERRLVKTILILTPASLTWQWQEEMQGKLYEEFTVLEKLSHLPAPEELKSLERCRWIISLDRAKSSRWAERLLAREYDLLIIDEAHKLKNHRTKAYRFVNQIRKRYVLMLTATPVHNDLLELHNLITILRPGHLGTRAAFRDNFVLNLGAGPKRRVLTWRVKSVPGVATYINSAKNARNPHYSLYASHSSKIEGNHFSLDRLPAVLPVSEGQRFEISQEDVANYAQTRHELSELLQQGYRVDNAWLVTFKKRLLWGRGDRRRKEDLCGLRIELSCSGEDRKVEADASSASAEYRPGRRTVYSRLAKFTKDGVVYLQQDRQARQIYRQDEEKSAWILKRTEDLSILQEPDLRQSEPKAIEEIELLLKQEYEVADFEAIEYENRWSKKRRTDFVCRLKLKSQPAKRPQQQRQTEQRTTPRNPAALRELLREVMIRNRRASVGIRFPPRKAAVYNLNLTPPERELYDKVTGYIRRRLQQMRDSGDGARMKAATRLTMMTLQKQLCSSPQAVARTLRKMVDRQPDDPELAECLVLAWGIRQGRKIEAVSQILAEHPGKFLIFTDYLPTMDTLQTALAEAGQEVVVFHGGMSALERSEAVRTFRGSARLMISTRSGSEGHNLQFCHQMINYDLPWNPMRIEQRVGRLHRLGQKETVTIFNLAANGTIEAYILDLLAHKIRMFELVIGELDLILGDLGDKRSFEQHLEQAWANSYSEEELLEMIAELERSLARSQASYARIRAVSDELSAALETYDELERIRKPLAS